MSDADNKINDIAAALRDIAVHLRQQPANKAIIYHLLSRVVRNNPNIFVQIHSEITSDGQSVHLIPDEIIHAAVASEANSKAAERLASGVGPGLRVRGPAAAGGSGPQDPGMDLRVAALEAGLHDVKAALSDIKVLSARVDERTGFLATGSGLSVLKADVILALERMAGRGTIWAAALSVAGLVVAAAIIGAVYLPYWVTLLRHTG
jgi:hypothetical protein